MIKRNIQNIRTYLNRYSLSISHTYELSDEYYIRRYSDVIKEYYQLEYKDRISGHATIEGTEQYSQFKLQQEVHPDNFKIHYKNNLKISSIGLGSYVGAPDVKDDIKLFGAIIDSIQSGGVNHIDTAINYRYMKSERTIGAALRYLLRSKSINRSQIFIASKAGYIPADGDRGILEEQLINDLIEKKILKSEDILGQCHSMSNGFLQYSLEQSLTNLGLDTLDIFYLHNSTESQQPLIKKQAYLEKLKKAFEFLEQCVQLGKIKNYGLASWVCFRAQPQEEGIYLSLQQTIEIAEQVAGKQHHFNYVQVPINMMMPETFTQKWQKYKNIDKQIEDQSFLAVARMCQMNVISSSPLLNGTLMQMPLSTNTFLCQNLGAKHLQFIRSIPSEALKATLIGQKCNRHVKMNLEIIKHRQLTPEEFWSCLKPIRRKQSPEDEIEVD